MRPWDNNDAAYGPVSAYKSFLQRLRGRFPSAVLVCVTFAADAFQEPYVEAMVKEVNAAGDAHVHWVGMPALRTYLTVTGLAPRMGRKERSGSLQPWLEGAWFRFSAGNGTGSDARGRRLP